MTILPDEYQKLTTRKEEQKRQKSLTEASGVGKAKGRVLSVSEADDLYEPLVAALSDSFEHIDKLLWLRYPHLQEQPVWSNTAAAEDQALAKILLKRGQSSPATAAAVRTLVDSSDYVTVGLMFVPRIQQTVQVIRSAPKREKKPFHVFRKVEA